MIIRIDVMSKAINDGLSRKIKALLEDFVVVADVCEVDVVVVIVTVIFPAVVLPVVVAGAVVVVLFDGL